MRPKVALRPTGRSATKVRFDLLFLIFEHNSRAKVLNDSTIILETQWGNP